MPIIKDGIKYGALYGIAREAGKTFNKHEESKQSSEQPVSSGSNQQPQQVRDAQGYLHQTWCNGQCNSQCNGAAVQGGK